MKGMHEEMPVLASVIYILWCVWAFMVLALAVQAKTDVQAGDDDFEAYRKRMMLGYKHRCGACPVPALRQDFSV